MREESEVVRKRKTSKLISGCGTWGACSGASEDAAHVQSLPSSSLQPLPIFAAQWCTLYSVYTSLHLCPVGTTCPW